jgi:hypothetical protein
LGVGSSSTVGQDASIGLGTNNTDGGASANPSGLDSGFGVYSSWSHPSFQGTVAHGIHLFTLQSKSAKSKKVPGRAGKFKSLTIVNRCGSCALP